MAKAAATPAAAIKEESLFWPRTAAPVVAAVGEGEADVADVADVAEVPEAVVADLVADEPVPVGVADAVLGLSVLVPLSVPLGVVCDAVLVRAALLHVTVLGRSWTPPRAQICLAATRVSVGYKGARVSTDDFVPHEGKRTLLLLLVAPGGDTAADFVQEGLRLANAGHIKTTLRRKRGSCAEFLQLDNFVSKRVQGFTELEVELQLRAIGGFHTAQLGNESRP